MKIVLISSNTATSPYPVYPLGMCVIGAALREAGHEVRALDLLKHPVDEIVGIVAAERPGLVGVSIRNIDNVNLLNEKRYIPAVAELIAALRAVSPAPVLLGGAGFSILPERILEETGADFGIVGEGERLVVEFAANLEQGRLPETRCLRSTDLLPGKSIGSAWYEPELMAHYQGGGSLAGIQSKRGCIHHCLYCTYPYLEGRAIRPRDPRDVADEIESLIAGFNVPQYHFTDSVFNDDEGHYIALLEEIDRRNLSVPWTAFFKPGNLDDATVTLMKRTGLRAVELGSDAACDRTLAKMGKNFSWEEVVRTNDLLFAHGISVAHYVMFGGPGETRGTVEQSIANIKALKHAAVFVFMGIRILPGSPLMRLAISEGVLAAEHDLLESVYYIASGLDHRWLHDTLEAAFQGISRIVFPPDACEGTIQMLKNLGHSGPLWELLVREHAASRRRPRRDPSVAGPQPG
jgi:lipid biosynthesis B12-binding/radical SAM protein